MDTDLETIKQLYKDLCDASINKDINKLSEILSDEYVLRHMTGKKQTKQEYLSALQSGDLVYYKSEHESIEVRLNGDSAMATCKSKILASPFGMSKSWWRLRQDLEFRRINGKWQIVQSIASMY